MHPRRTNIWVRLVQLIQRPVVDCVRLDELEASIGVDRSSESWSECWTVHRQDGTDSAKW